MDRETLEGKDRQGWENRSPAEKDNREREQSMRYALRILRGGVPSGEGLPPSST